MSLCATVAMSEHNMTKLCKESVFRVASGEEPTTSDGNVGGK